MKLTDCEQIKEYFKRQDEYYVFVSPTNFNMLGMDCWVNNWKNFCLIDVFDGCSASEVLPQSDQFPVFNSVEEINEFLLQQSAFTDYLKTIKKNKKVNVCFLFYSKELEVLCRSLGVNLIMPEHKLVKHVDSKIVTTQLGNEADVPSVPNVIARVKTYADLLRLCDDHGLGHSLVIQRAYGDSGKTTYFIEGPADFEKIRHKIEDENVKIMKRIRCISTAIEGCATRHGTFVGPLLGELIGNKSLTPYPGGWCGNEFNRLLFSAEVRQQAKRLTERFGEKLYQAGYRGYFEVDYLIDVDSGQLYLGELNPRFTGITAITNLSEFCQQHVPLLLFHLLEYSGLEFPLDVAHYNEAAMLAGMSEESGQLVVKHLDEELKLVHSAPLSGVYRLCQTDLGLNLEFVSQSDNPRDAKQDDHIYLFRVLRGYEYAYQGADLAILFTPFPCSSTNGNLTEQTQHLIQAVRDLFVLRDLTDEELLAVERFRHAESNKGSY